MRSVYPRAHKKTDTHALVELAGSKEKKQVVRIFAWCGCVLPTVLPTYRELQQGKRRGKDLEQGIRVPSLRKRHLSKDRKEVREQAKRETAGRMFQAEETVTEGL